MEYEDVMKELSSLYNPAAVAGMARFGVKVKKAYGVSAPAGRALAKRIGRNHGLAQKLWHSEIHDARGLAALIDDPHSVTERQMESWARDFDSWDICDGCCNNLFRKTKFAYQKASKWTSRKEEYVKRAGFVLMACLAVHDKKASDQQFVRFLAIIKRESRDERNFVRKAVNWALRQIGKRNLNLRRRAIQTAREIHALDSRAARWIAADALRELSSEKTTAMVRSRQARRLARERARQGVP
jgi:3-methyladenine DNA glycosylase AlkD